MSRSLNKIILIGHVGSKPEIRVTDSGTKLAKVSLATNYKVGNQERTDWHRLTFWLKLADVVEQYVEKGDRLYVEGRVEYGSYERDGQTIPTTDIHVRELVMLGSPDAVTAQAGGVPDAPREVHGDPNLPF